MQGIAAAAYRHCRCCIHTYEIDINRNIKFTFANGDENSSVSYVKMWKRLYNYRICLGFAVFMFTFANGDENSSVSYVKMWKRLYNYRICLGFAVFMCNSSILLGLDIITSLSITFDSSNMIRYSNEMQCYFLQLVRI